MIRNMRYFSRKLLFNGMRFGKLSPMDGDAILDVHGKATIFYEVKCHYGSMSMGQRICLQNLVNNTRDDRMAVVVLCDCHDDNPDNPILLEACTVRQVYEDGKWRAPDEKITVLDYTNQYIARVREKFGLKAPEDAE